MSLPANLPSISRARLPQAYEKAKGALQQCTRIDECKDWADKAEALASYAKQAGDDSLRKMADRIQARAIRRCGRLLEKIDKAKNQYSARGSAPPSRSAAARNAGLSRDQKRTALRVARVPKSEFESAVESDHPPSVTALSEAGKLPAAFDLEGRDPEEFSVATIARGHIRRIAEFTDDNPPHVVFRGLLDRERKDTLKRLKSLRRWIDKLIGKLEVTR